MHQNKFVLYKIKFLVFLSQSSQKEHVERVAVGMLKEVTDWEMHRHEFDGEYKPYTFDQLGETKRQYTVDQDSIKEVMHKSNEAFNTRSNTLNNELHSNFEEQKASLQKAGKHLADIVKIEEEKYVFRSCIKI